MVMDKKHVALALLATITTTALVMKSSSQAPQAALAPAGTSAEAPVKDKTEAPTQTPQNESKRARYAREMMHHDHPNGTKHTDGSTYVDLADPSVAPGQSTTQRVFIPRGATLVSDSVEYLHSSAGHFSTVRFDVDDKGLVTLIATNTSNEPLPLIAVFRYRQ